MGVGPQGLGFVLGVLRVLGFRVLKEFRLFLAV